MANYLHLATGLVKSESQIRNENPQTSYPASFPVPEGYALVFPAPQPAHDPITQFVREVAPKLTSKGHLEQQYEILSLDESSVNINKARIKDQIISAVQNRLDNFAKSKNYDNIMSATTYVSSTISKFAKDGQDAVHIRDKTWETLHMILDEIDDGIKPIPKGYIDIEELLPKLEWSN